MSPRTRNTVLLVALSAVLCLSGCARVQRWVSKPVDRPTWAQPKASTNEPEAQPREDFSNYQPRPIPSGPDAPTDRDAEAARLKWLQRISIDLYREMGMRDARWDKPAEALLEAYARIESEQHQRPTDAGFAKLADAAMATECPDPLVRIAAGDAYLRVRRYKEALKHTYFDDPPDAPEYPVIALLPRDAVGWQVQSHRGAATSFIDGSHQQFATNLRQALPETKLADTEVRAMYDWLEPMMAKMHEHQHASLAETLSGLVDKPEVDPWLIGMVMGYLEFKAAWAARGDGFASEVSEGGWAGFQEHMPKARAYLTQAYKLHPDRPEPAGLLVSLSNADGSSDAECRAWFDRAVAAQMDYDYAYRALRTHLLPRWGGSHEEMWALAEECLATKRYDTIVPWQAADMATLIAVFDGRTDFVADATVYSTLTDLFRAYLRASDPGEPEATVRTVWAGLAAVGGHHNDVIAQLNAAGDDLDGDRLMTDFRRTPANMRRDAQIALSPQAQELRTADQARAAHDWAGAKTHYQAVLASSPSAAVAGVARGGLRATEALQAFSAGKTVQLVPGFTLDQCLQVIGEWEVASDGTLIHRPNGDEYGELLFPLDVHDDYRLSMQVAFAPDDDRASAGLTFGYGWPPIGLQTGHERLWADRYRHIVHAKGARMGSGGGSHEVHVNRRMTLTAEVYHQTFACYVDDERFLSGFPLMEWYEEPGAEIVGVYAMYRENVTDALRIESVTLEPLTQTPEDWEEPGVRVEALSRPWAGTMPEGR